MLIFRRTSILESTAQTLVNTVNCVGVMGKGIALAFKQREPDMFVAYKHICDQKQLEPGKLWLWRDAEQWVLNFPTKNHWRHPSKLEWIEAGLAKFVVAYEAQGIREISFPRLGCGNGGLDWDDVRPLMVRYLSKLPIDVYIHDYERDIGLPEHMEAAAKSLHDDILQEPTFEAFMAALRQAIDLTGENLVELESERRFTASLNDDGNLKIMLPDSSCILEREDLRGVWIGLMKGLLTREKAGWSVAQGGEPLLSILSLLPQVRPVEIQRGDAGVPEVAIELRPRHRSEMAPTEPRQREFAWH